MASESTYHEESKESKWGKTHKVLEYSDEERKVACEKVKHKSGGFSAMD